MQKKLNYTDPQSTQTLREGILELRAAEGAVDDAAENVAEDLIASIEVHDAIHVLFACPTNLKGEISAHIWAVFGTTMSMHQMHSVNRHQDHRTVLKKIGHFRLLKRWAALLPLLFLTLIRSKKMTTKWPAENYELYLDMRLDEIRSKFNIELVSSGESGGNSNGAALRHIRS